MKPNEEVKNVMVGQYKPKQNQRCPISGKIYGPGHPKKMGYIVQIDWAGGISKSFKVAGRDEVEEIKDMFVDKRVEDDGIEEIDLGDEDKEEDNE